MAAEEEGAARVEEDPSAGNDVVHGLDFDGGLLAGGEEEPPCRFDGGTGSQDEGDRAVDQAAEDVHACIFAANTTAGCD